MRRRRLAILSVILILICAAFLIQNYEDIYVKVFSPQRTTSIEVEEGITIEVITSEQELLLHVGNDTDHHFHIGIPEIQDLEILRLGGWEPLIIEPVVSNLPAALVSSRTERDLPANIPFAGLSNLEPGLYRMNLVNMRLIDSGVEYRHKIPDTYIEFFIR